MKVSLLAFLGSLASMFFLSGCLVMRPSGTGIFRPKFSASAYKNKATKEINERDVSLKFEDIPVPSGCKLSSKDSFVFSNGDSKVGILRYTGKLSSEAVTSFFINQMPMYNWEMINVIEFKTVILNFEKETQTCTIIVDPSGSKSYITIASGPIGV